MPLPSFNMEDILSMRVPNFQSHPAFAFGYREIQNGQPVKEERLRKSNVHSQLTMAAFSSAQVRQGIGNNIDGDDIKSATCQYSVIKRTADIRRENPPSSAAYDALLMRKLESSRLDHDVVDSSRHDHPSTTTTTKAIEILGHRSSDFRRKHRRIRTVFSDNQLTALEDRFTIQKYLSTPDRETVAAGLGLTQMQVKTWYQNRRMRWKKSVLSGECLEDLTKTLKKAKGRPKEQSGKQNC